MEDNTIGLIKVNDGVIVALERTSKEGTLFILEDTTFGFMTRDEFESREALMTAFKEALSRN